MNITNYTTEELNVFISDLKSLKEIDRIKKLWEVVDDNSNDTCTQIMGIFSGNFISDIKKMQYINQRGTYDNGKIINERELLLEYNNKYNNNNNLTDMFV